MRFDERFLDELKGRLRLSDVIGRTVKLRRQGREYVGLSPFNKERSPSFFVNDDKGFYHDFSSGKHGDLISFLQETERLSFPEAVERLASEAGLSLPAPDPRAAEAEQRRASLQDWLDEAARWFEAQLRRPAGVAARLYLDTRGLPEAERLRFRLGYAPANRTALKDHLIAKGAKPGELVEAGLLIQPEDGGGAPYDRFRDRIIFPIADGRGRLVSFGGRALDPEAKAKYLNGPETPLFSKSRTLYGLHDARRLLHAPSPPGSAAAEADRALVVVEGYFDVIACQRAGIAAVAPLGTALTEEQMELLWRLHDEPTLSFDGDEAGRRAEGRTLDRALPLLKPGRSFRFVRVTGGKDPDEVLREQGEAALRTQLAETRPFVGVLFERERATTELNTPEHRSGLKARLRKLAGMIADQDLAYEYRRELLERFEALWPLIQPARTYDQAARAFRAGRGRPKDRRLPLRNDLTAEGASARHRLATAPDLLPAALAEAALNHPQLIDERLECMSVQGFGDESLSALAHEMVRARMGAEALDSQTLRTHLARSGQEAPMAEVAWAAKRSHAAFLQPDHSFAEVRALWSRAFDLLLQITALERALADAKSDLEQEEDFTTLSHLKAERDTLRRRIQAGTYLDDQPSN